MTNSNLDKRNSRNYLSLDTPLDVIFSDVYGRMVIQCIREVLKDNSQLGKIIPLSYVRVSWHNLRSSCKEKCIKAWSEELSREMQEKVLSRVNLLVHQHLNNQIGDSDQRPRKKPVVTDPQSSKAVSTNLKFTNNEKARLLELLADRSLLSIWRKAAYEINNNRDDIPNWKKLAEVFNNYNDRQYESCIHDDQGRILAGLQLCRNIDPNSCSPQNTGRSGFSLLGQIRKMVPLLWSLLKRYNSVRVKGDSAENRFNRFRELCHDDRVLMHAFARIGNIQNNPTSSLLALLDNMIETRQAIRDDHNQEGNDHDTEEDEETSEREDSVQRSQKVETYHRTELYRGEENVSDDRGHGARDSGAKRRIVPLPRCSHTVHTSQRNGDPVGRAKGVQSIEIPPQSSTSTNAASPLPTHRLTTARNGADRSSDENRHFTRSSYSSTHTEAPLKRRREAGDGVVDEGDAAKAFRTTPSSASSFLLKGITCVPPQSTLECAQTVPSPPSADSRAVVDLTVEEEEGVYVVEQPEPMDRRSRVHDSDPVTSHVPVPASMVPSLSAAGQYPMPIHTTLTPAGGTTTVAGTLGRIISANDVDVDLTVPRQLLDARIAAEWHLFQMYTTILDAPYSTPEMKRLAETNMMKLLGTPVGLA